MKLGYYPGCSLHSTASEYDASCKAVCSKLGIELVEIPNWICCGTSPAHSSSKLLGLALPLQNMALSEKAGLNEVVVPCASCFQRLKVAAHETKEDPALADKLKEIITAPYSGNVKILHPLEILSKQQISSDERRATRLRQGFVGQASDELITKDLSQLKVCCYYGCLLTRPCKVMQFDECEYPMSMDNLLRSLGIQTLDWSYKTDCCGAAFSLTETDVVLKLTNNILKEAKVMGADAIAVACPLCHANLDTRQEEIEKKFNTKYDLPILYFTQLMGLAFGIAPRKLGLHKHLVSTSPVIARTLGERSPVQSEASTGRSES